MTYYHVVIEARENLGKHDESREITLFDITDLQSLIPEVIRPYLSKAPLVIEDEIIPFENIDLFSIKQTVLPIQQLIEEEQRELPSNTDITITAFEIFNDRELSQDVTQVIIDLLDH
ncbi:hypothetical protein F4V57_10410 [Acinetobacter qingfengensis]|uniref:Uncharacterized protein n=1 Tax=Acinetobacter qingfengensis TaxID=1262585 RepID=A0A1E7R5A9_9GAMM|nr:hypothetical protein [Acinetobacter qingfengensis]KAA8732470.1 hypothetical protein F4V57_10410 [Acinetobacter qingfengensis]OEY94465.1 hypothetical protein BJI46_03740 [Acinetobacter qingfengensis]